MTEAPGAEDLRLPRDALALAFVVGLTVAPLVPGLLRGEIPGHPTSDLVDHVQGSWWFGGEVLAGRFPREVRGFLHPDGGALWYPDPVGALIALPARGWGPFAAHAVTLVVQGALGAAVAFVAARRWLSRGAAVLAASVIAASGYGWALVHSGVSEYLGTWAVTAFVFAWVEAIEARRRPVAAVAAAALALAGAQAFYYAVFCATFAGCTLLVDVLRRRAVPWALAGAILAVGLAPVAGLGAVAQSTFGPGSAIDPATAPGFRPSVPPGTDPWTFVAPWDTYHPDTPALGNPGILEANPLPWLALALALWGARGARWAPAAALWFVLALGPSLAGFGADKPLGVRIPLPGALLWLVPGSPYLSVHHPYRMVAVTLPLLGWLAGRGLERLVPAARRDLVGVVAALVVVGQIAAFSPAPLPLVTTPPPDLGPYADLPPGAVLDWPPDLRGPNRAYAWAALGHGHPVPYGVNAFLSRAFREDPAIRALAAPLALRDRTRNRDTEPLAAPWLPPRDHGGLAGLGVGAVVLHPERLSPAERGPTEAWLDANARRVRPGVWFVPGAVITDEPGGSSNGGAAPRDR